MSLIVSSDLPFEGESELSVEDINQCCVLIGWASTRLYIIAY